MGRYALPPRMRYATLKERRQFYKQEFDLQKIAEWFPEAAGKPAFAVIIGRHTRIYPAKYAEDASTTIIIDEYRNFDNVKSLISEFLPEAVYYDRNVYNAKNRKVGQELAFDLDPENITCPIHGTLADKMKKHQGLSFCELELDLVKAQAINLYEYLESSFSSMKIVYSGRGYHIHVFDEATYQMARAERKRLANKVKAKEFAIDEWVTTGDMRLIRLPFSLHGLVSRVVVPLEVKELKGFNPVSDPRCMPRFLKL